jgi:protein-tyrosine phosphatase
MVDLHFHALPGIDDGARNLDEARRMCELAAQDGCHTIVATPHQRHEFWENRDRAALGELLVELRTVVGSSPRLLLGGEVKVDSELLDDLDRFPDCGIAPLAGSRWLLLELPRSGPGPDPVALTHEITVAGWRPIFAHPEFVPTVARDLELASRLVDLGARFQLTAMSITGDFGRDAQSTCTAYLEQGLAHFVASDAHRPTGRPPGLSRARRWIADRFGEETARLLTETHPAAVVAGSEVPAQVVAA